MVYMVFYKLGSPSAEHSGIKQAIEKASNGEWACFWDTVWLIRSDLPTASEVFSLLHPHLTADDRCLVIEVKSNFDGCLEDIDWQYLRQRLGL